VSRGTTAIYLALTAAGIKEGKVITPSLLCMSPINAIIYAGLSPKFVDISLKNCQLDPARTEDVLKKDKHVKAILLPHLYGQAGDIEAFLNLANKYGVMLIEDACQSLGASFKRKPLGSFGDFSVFSFGYSKIIDVETGGALLFDEDKYIPMLKKKYRDLKPRLTSHNKMIRKYREQYYHLASIYRKGGKREGLYSHFPNLFKDLYLFRSFSHDTATQIIDELGNLDYLIKKRRTNAEFYRTHLMHDCIRHLNFDKEGAYWRFSFFVTSRNQHDLADKMRIRKVDVSNWYPPVHKLFGVNIKLKNTEYAGKHIFNLWTSPSLSQKALQKNIDVVHQVLDKYAQ
jgi:dTDP-4-amino-4,6-dideoxygalactose transaminase